MSRKDFELIASVLKEEKAAWELVLRMAERLATTNPRFDRRKFIERAYWLPTALSPAERS